ncbi:translation initiation factor IF-2 N-terminal domain-containing protein [Mycobacterium arosiense]|uniref:translation initiation factor IF-2 N-terminal domain-containing protein n=1 Tax=Mycobacterium arosiense TaxID=425468 RepID=UPI0011522317
MAQGKARVHELASEFGVTAKDILILLSGWDEFVKSASSTVEAPLTRRVREHYAARPPRPITTRDYGVSAGPTRRGVTDDNGFGAAVERARRQSRRASPGSHQPGEIEAALYRCVIDPVRTRRGSYTPEERDRVERFLRRWLETWLDDMAEWIRVSGGQHPDVAVQLCTAGLTRRRRPAPRIRTDRSQPRHHHRACHPRHCRDQGRRESGQGVPPLAVCDWF